MILHRGNRTEALVAALAELVARPLDDPFQPETIVVQGRGMARWLSLELARRLGVWANPAFPFPRAFMQQVAAAFLGAAPAGADAYQPERLRWIVAAELPRHLEAVPFAPVRRFLDGGRDGAKLLPLATRIADLFDQYAVFRPDLVLDWERGGGDRGDWQPALWRALVARLGPYHPAARAADLLRALPAAPPPRAPFPARVAIFGLATLPPVYVDVLAALAPLVELHLFVLSPSDEYWGDVPSRRERRRALRRDGGAGEAALYLDAPPLLASLGRIGRDFQSVLEARADYQADDHYADPGQATLLAALQSDLLHLRSRRPDERLMLDPADQSIAVHSCHAPMREIEVLHDRLVALFHADPSLRPHDVVVMAPAIDRYAPLIEAVFTSPDRPRLAYYIADRRARATRDVVDVFLRTLELLGGRLPVSAVLDLLALDAVRARFALDPESLDAIRGWVEEAGVTWGADAEHRAAEGLPPRSEHTWRFGLDRLLLGTALESAEDELWQGCLPCGDLEGSAAAVFGQFVAFVETLLEQRRRLAAARPVEEWQPALGALLAAVAARSPVNADQHDAILMALAELAAGAAQAGFAAPIGLDPMRRLLDAELAKGAAPPGFITGSVTLCELMPMRTIPFRVVCLVGLSDGTFPRVQRPLAFDHIARQPRPGDRTARDDDRYLFLEALLSARDRLLITYVGRSITDNAALPPSVVLSELLEAVDATAVAPADDGTLQPARRAIVHQHPLQPFSPLAFGPPGPLSSHARSQFQGAEVSRHAPLEPPPFLPGPLPDPAPLSRLELEELIDFFTHAVRWFVRQRLRLRLSGDREAARDRDPIALDSLAEWAVGDHLLRRARRGAAPDSAWPVLSATGVLPLGTPGRLLVAGRQTAAAEIAARFAASCGGDPLPPEELVLAVGDVELAGVLPDRYPPGLVQAQFSRVGKYHELRLWIRHLMLAAVCQPGASSVLIGRAARGDGISVVRFHPADQPRRHLATLVDLFRRGQARPLPFFQTASRAYAAELAAAGDPQRAVKAALRAFTPKTQGFGFADGQDENVALLFRAPPAELSGGAPPAGDEDMRAVAQAVFAPLLAHREETT